MTVSYAYTATFKMLHFKDKEDITILDPRNSPNPFAVTRPKHSKLKKCKSSKIVWRKDLDPNDNS